MCVNVLAMIEHNPPHRQMFLAHAVFRRISSVVGGCGGQQDRDEAGRATTKFEGRWFGDENKKQIVRKPKSSSSPTSPASPPSEAILIAGQSQIPGQWLAPNVFAAVWSSGSAEATVWVGVFDGTDDCEPRTAAITTAAAAQGGAS